MQAVLIEIGGLRPGAPALALIRTLSSRPGVLRASVNESARQVTVAYDPELVTVEELRALIQRCGLHCISHVVIADPSLQPSTEEPTNPSTGAATVEVS